MNALLRIAAWTLAIALVVAPVVAVLNGWIGGSRWPMRHLVVTGEFRQVSDLKVRNAVLPQVTSLALALGEVLSGAVLVEVVFGYPGIGSVLYNAIKDFDYYLIQGIVFTVIVALGFTTFVLDVIYPWLDPRISYRRA